MQDEEMVQTVYGMIPAKDLEKREFNQNGSHVTEYYLRGRLVHRSASTQLTGVSAVGTARI